MNLYQKASFIAGATLRAGAARKARQIPGASVEERFRPARAVLNILQVAALFAAVISINLLRPLVPEVAFSAVLAAALLGLYFGMRRSTALRLWGVFIVAIALFATLRTFADSTGVPVGYLYPIAASEGIFGTTGSAWLQKSFYTFGQVGPLEVFSVIVYGTYFFSHYVAGSALWRTDQQQFRV